MITSLMPGQGASQRLMLEGSRGLTAVHAGRFWGPHSGSCWKVLEASQRLMLEGVGSFPFLPSWTWRGSHWDSRV